MDERPLLLVGRLRHRHWVALDVAMAAGLTLLLGGAAVALGTPAAAPYIVCMYAPLAVRRLWPLPVLAVISAAAALSLAAGIVPAGTLEIGEFPDALRVLAWNQPMAVTIALYTVAVNCRRGTALAALLVTGIGLSALILATRPAPEAVGAVLICWFLFASQWATGLVVRERRLYMTRLAARTAREAVLDERLRIARDLHDSVAHSMSVITVQASVAAHVAEARPAAAREALAQIEATGRAAQVEMRRMLGLLRREDDGAPQDAPGPAALPELVRAAEAAGVEVTLDVDPGLQLGNGPGLTVYRLVQEALTNTAKHAAPTRCLVTVTAARDGVRVRITDEGPRNGAESPGRRAGPPGDGGHGLAGMRERVALYGGELTAGPLSGGGFAVEAFLPDESAPRPVRQPAQEER
ncbi:histidine kinase [Nonomuraea sp. NPDC055795]